MSKELLKMVSDMDRQSRIAKYPSMPPNYIAGTKYSDKTANGLTKVVIDFLKLSGYLAERSNNMGRMIDKTKVVKNVLGYNNKIGSIEWQKGSGTKGTSDIKSTIKGRSVAWEVKIGKDRQSDDQKSYQAMQERAGGYYFIIKSFEDFYGKYLRLLEELK